MTMRNPPGDGYTEVVDSTFPDDRVDVSIDAGIVLIRSAANYGTDPRLHPDRPRVDAWRAARAGLTPATARRLARVILRAADAAEAADR